MNGISHTVTFNDMLIKFTLFSSKNYKEYSPITQSYSLLLNENNKLLIGKHPVTNEWKLPDGTVEQDEDPLDTLHREVDEEVSADIKDVELIGVQKAEFLNKNREPEYQLRFFARIKELKELTPDPDNGKLWELKFIEIDELKKYIDWGIATDWLVEQVQRHIQH